MSCCWSSRGSLEIGPIIIKRSTRNGGLSAPTKAKESGITLSFPLILSNNLENLASNRLFREKRENRRFMFAVCTRMCSLDLYVYARVLQVPTTVLRLRRHPAISGRISCHRGSGVKGVARQLVKRIIPAYVTRSKLMPPRIIKSFLEPS